MDKSSILCPPERMPPSGGASSVGPWPESQEATRFQFFLCQLRPGSSKVHEGRPSTAPRPGARPPGPFTGLFPTRVALLIPD